MKIFIYLFLFAFCLIQKGQERMNCSAHVYFLLLSRIAFSVFITYVHLA